MLGPLKMDDKSLAFLQRLTDVVQISTLGYLIVRVSTASLLASLNPGEPLLD